MSPPGPPDGGCGDAGLDDASGPGVDVVVHPTAAHATTPAHQTEPRRP